MKYRQEVASEYRRGEQQSPGSAGQSGGPLAHKVLSLTAQAGKVFNLSEINLFLKKGPEPLSAMFIAAAERALGCGCFSA